MKNLTRRSVLISAAAFAGLGLSTSAEAATGSVRLKIVSGGFIVGVGGGSGVLIFRGVRYPLSVGGVSLGATIGVSGTELVGEAFHLHDPRDIEGTYSAASAGLAVAGGAGVVQLIELPRRSTAPVGSSSRIQAVTRGEWADNQLEVMRVGTADDRSRAGEKLAPISRRCAPRRSSRAPV